MSDQFEPFNEKVKEKTYAKSNATLSAQEAAMDLPEADFRQAPAPPARTKADEASKPSAPAQPITDLSGNDLPDAEKKKAAKKAAEMFVDGYRMLHVLADEAIQIKQAKLIKKGINLNMVIPYDESGATCTVAEYIEAANGQNKDTFVVGEKFADEIIPPLTRIFMKKGIGASDEHQVLWIFGKDFVMKGVALNGAVKTNNQLIATLVQYMELNRVSGSAAPVIPQVKAQPAQPEVQVPLAASNAEETIPVYDPEVIPNERREHVEEIEEHDQHMVVDISLGPNAMVAAMQDPETTIQNIKSSKRGRRKNEPLNE